MTSEVEANKVSAGRMGVPGGPPAEPAVLSPADIRHNMICCILMDSIFLMGWADVQLALQPLLVHLKASNTLIGVVAGANWAGAFGVIWSPFITRKFRYKKWYLFMGQVPCTAMIALTGLAVLLAQTLGLSNATLLHVVTGTILAYWVIGGFTSLPHQEYVAACIPMAYRGRFGGLSYTIGSLLGLASAWIGRVILLNVAKPMAYGYLFLMSWFVTQAGYVSALFGRERPTPVEKSPPAWSRGMFRAFWDDKKYVTYMIQLNLVTIVAGMPVFNFIYVYGLRELKMLPATMAVMMTVSQLTRIAFGGPIGMITDRLGARRLVPAWMLLGAVGYMTPVLFPSQLGVYIGIGITMLYWSGANAAWGVIGYGLPSPENRAGHFSIQLVLGYGTMGLGSIIAGAMIDLFTFRTVFTAIACMLAALVPVTMRMFRSFSDDPRDYS